MSESEKPSTGSARGGSLPSPARIIASAALWSFTIGLIAPFAVAALFGFVEGLTGNATWIRSPRQVAFLVAATMLVVQLTMLAVAYVKAPRVGMGNRAVGLGNVPVRRRGWIALMTIVLLAFVTVEVASALRIPSLRFLLAPSVAAHAIASQESAMRGLGALFIALLTVSAPIAEEMFFRGWVWTGLRHRWPASIVAAFTGVLWLVMHIPDYRYKPLALLPLALCLSLARHYGGSVRASIMVHVANNAFAIVVLPAVLERLQ